MIESSLLLVIQSQFRLRLESIHGINHWKRVEKIRLYLAKNTTADPVVITHFAYLHDSQRQSEDTDAGHGNRAADYVKRLYQKGQLLLSQKQVDNLTEACRNHTDSYAKPGNITIATCWDADRLDLWRLNIEPDPFLLNTDEARKTKSIEFSRRLNRSSRW